MCSFVLNRPLCDVLATAKLHSSCHYHSGTNFEILSSDSRHTKIGIIQCQVTCYNITYHHPLPIKYVCGVPNQGCWNPANFCKLCLGLCHLWKHLSKGQSLQFMEEKLKVGQATDNFLYLSRPVCWFQGEELWNLKTRNTILTYC